jgi:signal transduction histidine kinase
MSRVLVVEDEDAVRANLVELLEAEGFGVLQAGNGLTGLTLAQEHRPDVILCDIMMPDLDGYEVLASLRQEPSTASLPFIFLTAKADRSDMRQGMNLGADDYLVKPFTRAELLSAITTRLARDATTRRAAQASLDELRGSIALAIPHELRTPLNGIVGLSEVLLADSSSRLPEDLREIAECIHESAMRLNDLVLSFLLYSTLEIAVRDPEYAKTVLDRSPCHVRETIDKIAIDQASRSNRESDLQVSCPEARVWLAAEYLEKVIKELVENAFKFSPSSTPVHISGDTDGQVYVISIEDHGHGMTARQVSQVGAYMQFERKRREQQGTGLGLITARRIVELHGGRLTIHSTSGLGTSVEVRLPICDGEA